MRQLTEAQLAKGIQSKPGNELAGIEGRAQLLIRLGDALSRKSQYFGDSGRPGNLIGMSRREVDPVASGR